MKPPILTVTVAAAVHNWGPLLLLLSPVTASFVITPHRPRTKWPVYSQCCSFPLRNNRAFLHHATVPSTTSDETTSSSSSNTEEESSSSSSSSLDSTILNRITEATPTSLSWGQMYDLPNKEVAFHALFSGIRSSTALGLRGKPFYLKQSEIVNAMGNGGTTEEEGEASSPFRGYFTNEDMELAVQEDFLDAQRGSTDNRKGWQVTPVSTPRGTSFEDARMTIDEINVALEKGTVIFNNIGAHIPKLAGVTLACTDASSLPCAVNMYVTAWGKRTSAPPHTDRQDVIVIQTQGTKHWRIYTPPNPKLKPHADMYARGKGDDNLPFHQLETSTLGCTKVLDVILEAGDVLFIPAGFPHTTDTVNVADDEEKGKEEGETSIHLTFNFDTHVWELDYLTLRQWALKRAGVTDTKLGQGGEEDNRYIGEVNLLPAEIREDVLDALPLGLLDETSSDGESLLEETVSELKRISHSVDPQTASAISDEIWYETTQRIRDYGIDIFNIHRDMYLSAIEEGRLRKAEDDLRASLGKVGPTGMTQERMERLSLFRVRTYFEQIDECKKKLLDWSNKNNQGGNKVKDSAGGEAASLPDNWEYTLPLTVGDEVEADLGGAYFPAKVTKVVNSGAAYDVEFFDGDRLNGLERNMIKLLKPPPAAAAAAANEEEDEETKGMTPKELKRWRKKQEKKKKKNRK